MSVSYTLYGSTAPDVSISHADILAEQKRSELFFARAESSGSESCYVEVAKWHEKQQGYFRYAFLKVLEVRLDNNVSDDSFNFTDHEIASHLADEINGSDRFAGIIHAMPSWPNEGSDSLTDG